MGLTALCIATACYAVAAVDLLRLGNVLLALVWGCYATANACLTWLSYREQLAEIAKRWL